MVKCVTNVLKDGSMWVIDKCTSWTGVPWQSVWYCWWSSSSLTVQLYPGWTSLGWTQRCIHCQLRNIFLNVAIWRHTEDSPSCFLKDIDGLIEVLQVPLNGAQTVPQLIGGPVQFLLGGSTPLQKQLIPSVMETLCCIHCLQYFTVDKQHETDICWLWWWAKSLTSMCAWRHPSNQLDR